MENEGITRRSLLSGGAAMAALFGTGALLGGCAPTNAGGSTAAVSASGAEEEWDDSADVVVIGCGTGLGAVLSAAEAGASVIALEKGSMVGGDWAINGGGFWAPATEPLKASGEGRAEAGGDDCFDIAKDEWISLSRGLCNEDLLQVCFEETQAFINDLAAQGGHEFILEKPSGAGVFPRVHYLKADDGSKLNGSTYVGIVSDRIAQTGAKILTDTAGLHILTDASGQVVGVEALDMNRGKRLRIGAKAVVVATGGYSSNMMMRAMFNPETLGWGILGGPHGTADGHFMLFEQGATIPGFAKVESAPNMEEASGTIPVSASDWATEFLSKPRSYFVVNDKLQRYYDESIPGATLKGDIPGSTFEIFDQTQLDEEDFNLVTAWKNENVHKAVEDGRIAKGNTVEELAAALRQPAADLQAAFDAYNACANGTADTFGRAADSFRAMDSGPYYATKCHRALGGPSCPISIKIDEKTRMVDHMGNAHDGIYAAGHDLVAYNIQGATYFYSGTGCSFGYALSLLAGREAAAYAASRS